MRLIKNAVPSGTIVPFHGGTVPSGWLLCDGSLVSRTMYAALFQAIGVSNGSGDGTTTFALPDMRGRFMRGSDNMGTGAAGRDPDAASRTAGNSGGNTGGAHGSVQSDGLQNITAYYSSASDVAITRSGDGLSGAFALAGTGRTYARGYQSAAQTSGDVSFDASRVARTSTETRPQNLASKYIIKT